MKTENPIVSVVMTVYSDEFYLRPAIDSILNQSFINFEFIIVKEFGSDKNTCNILTEYAEKDTRIKILENTRKLGFAASLNRGIGEATGKYIARMDGDDLSLRNRLKYQVEFMEKHSEVLICGGNLKFLFMNGTLFQKFFCRRFVFYPRTTKELRNYIIFGCPFAHPSVMMRKSVIDSDNIRYNENIQTEDYDLWSKLIYKYQVANLPMVLIRYRQHLNNATKIQSRKVELSSNFIRANIIRHFLPEIRNEYISFTNIKDKKSLSFAENILYRLYKEHSDVFYDKAMLKKHMYHQYFYYKYYGTDDDSYTINPRKQFNIIFADLYTCKELRTNVYYWLIAVKYALKSRLDKIQ